MTNTDWDRINRVMAETGFGTVTSFSRAIGMKRAESLYQIKKGNNKMSIKIANMINVAFPQYSIAWLILGDENRETTVHVPIYESLQDAVNKSKPLDNLPMPGKMFGKNCFGIQAKPLVSLLGTVCQISFFTADIDPFENGRCYVISYENKNQIAWLEHIDGKYKVLFSRGGPAKTICCEEISILYRACHALCSY